MGNIYTGLNYKLHPDVTPSYKQESKWDPNYGFPEQREKKVMKATEKELYLAKIPLAKRDYCAHDLLAYRTCYQDKFPFLSKCDHEKHQYMHCQYEEFVDRMKDYERERRLMEREKRKAAAA